MKALLRQVKKRESIRVLSDVAIVELRVVHGRCRGAWGLDKYGEPIKISAGAVVLAAGGATQAFQKNMNPEDVSGDGYLLGYRAGAELTNMEFMQAGIGFSFPFVSMFNAYIWAAHPRLGDKDGKSFLSRHIPESLDPESVMDEHRKHFPFSSSDISKHLEIAIQKQINSGNTSAHGGVLCDLTHFSPEYVNAIPDDCGLHHMWPIARDYMLGKGVDLLKDKTEISVFAHAVNGGVRIDEQAASTLPGLFAAGEVAGGPHGADRLGGNMMVACQVFGGIAGTNAAEFAKRLGAEDANDGSAEKPGEDLMFLLKKRYDAKAAIAKLQKLNQEKLLITRSEESLGQVLAFAANEMERIKQAPDDTKADLDVFRLLSLLCATRLMAQAARDRKESRGSHYREDYPVLDPKFGSCKNQKAGGDRV
jgi:L-aspartate oxidase